METTSTPSPATPTLPERRQNLQARREKLVHDTNLELAYIQGQLDLLDELEGHAAPDAG